MFSTAFIQIQSSITYNINFYNICGTILSKLSEIDTENTAIQAGQSTAFDNMPQLLTDLLSAVSYCKSLFLGMTITPEQIIDYEAGTFTLDQALSINMLTFFNSLQKLRLLAEGAQGIIAATPRTDVTRYSADADDYKLTSGQFDTESSASVNSKIQDKSSFIYYTVQDGDNARVVAYKMLKDSEKFISILQINKIAESDFITGSLVGQQIKIPVSQSGSSRNPNNLIYEADDSNILTFLHGKDIKVDINGNMILGPSGDILPVIGPDNAYAAVLARLNNAKGSLNVFTPAWGVTPLGDGNCPLMVRVERYLSDVVGQIQSDPRVSSVKLNVDKMQLSGEAISVSGAITFLGTDNSVPFEV